jgi:hypothetical protein
MMIEKVETNFLQRRKILNGPDNSFVPDKTDILASNTISEEEPKLLMMPQPMLLTPPLIDIVMKPPHLDSRLLIGTKSPTDYGLITLISTDLLGTLMDLELNLPPVSTELIVMMDIIILAEKITLKTLSQHFYFIEINY